MILFSYPMQRHRRTLVPGPYKDYRRYKPALRKEFDATCVYCRMQERWGGYGGSPFTVDHYRSQKFFPKLEAVYRNLFYSCPLCNTKKDTWPLKRNKEPFGFVVPNPCDYIMSDFFEYTDDCRAIAKSPDGKDAIELLGINEPLRTRYRQACVANAEGRAMVRRELLRKRRHLKQRITKGLSSTRAAILRQQLVEIKHKLDLIAE